MQVYPKVVIHRRHARRIKNCGRSKQTKRQKKINYYCPAKVKTIAGLFVAKFAGSPRLVLECVEMAAGTLLCLQPFLHV